MRLSILIFCYFHGICWTSDKYCIYQPRSVHVKEEDSVTIPCIYTYPEQFIGKAEIRWAENDGIDCSNIRKNIMDKSGNIKDNYKDRISIVNHTDNRTSSLIIRGLKPSDGITFCCVVFILPGTNKEFSWKDRYGTSITFQDRNSVSQTEELMAVPGEEMIIPCHYPLKTLRVDWFTGDDVLCANKKNIYSLGTSRTGDVNKFSVLNFPEDISLRIHSVQKNKYSYFCCHVTTSNGITLKSRIGTELTIADSSSPPPFTVTQPYNITGHIGESVTISCSYTSYMESDVMGVNIYWRLGNLSGPYVYQPYKEMVHPSYRGRTEIRGAADLHIQGLQMSDVSTYYCFVMIRVCTGNEKYEKLIQYGEGTRLFVTELELVTTVSISIVVLLVFLCVILVILKKTGVICKKKNVSDEMKTSDSPVKESRALEERPYCEISVKNVEQNEVLTSKEGAKDKRVENEKEENENILYSELNKSKLQQRNPAPCQQQEEQVVYAAVISPDSRK